MAGLVGSIASGKREARAAACLRYLPCTTGSGAAVWREDARAVEAEVRIPKLPQVFQYFSDWRMERPSTG